MTFVEKYSNPQYVISDDNRKRITLRDKGEQRKFVVQNISYQRIVTFRVDGGIITDKTKNKCDYALWTEHDKVFFVELKGGSYSDALCQVEETIMQLIHHSAITTKEVHARIVLSTGRAVGATTSNKHEVKLKRLLKKYNGTLRKSSIIMEERI